MAIDIPAVVQSTDSLLCPGTKSVAHCVCVCMREAENQRMMLEQNQKGALQVAQVSGFWGYQKPIGPFVLST